mmetsp:Transcript_4769/g.19595  ORF Transcript_4769/g.19595 Transcript_4769/m.19595 type:complete len:436 (-) Transcript_4769:267-1574(-)
MHELRRHRPLVPGLGLFPPAGSRRGAAGDRGAVDGRHDTALPLGRELLKARPQVALHVDHAGRPGPGRDAVAPLPGEQNLIHIRLALRRLDPIGHHLRPPFELALSQQLGVDSHHEVAPVLRRHLVGHRGAHQGSRQELDHERQIGGLVSAVKADDGAAVDRRVGILRDLTRGVDGDPVRDLLARGPRLQQPEERVRAGRHVEDNRLSRGGNADADGVGAEDGLDRTVWRHELGAHGEHHRNETLLRDLLRVVSQRAGGRGRVVRAADAEPVSFGLLDGHVHRLVDDHHARVFVAVEARGQLCLVLDRDRCPRRVPRDALRGHLDDALVVSSQLRVHHDVEQDLSLDVVVAVGLDGASARLGELGDRHGYVRGRGRRRGLLAEERARDRRVGPAPGRRGWERVCPDLDPAALEEGRRAGERGGARAGGRDVADGG